MLNLNKNKYFKSQIIKFDRNELNITNSDYNLIQDIKNKIRSYVNEKGNSKEINLLEKAFTEVEEYHASQFRKSGQPVIIHLLRVAYKVCQVGLDVPTVIAAILHDIVEDTSKTKDDIEKQFSPWYAKIVEGLTKVKYSEKDIQSKKTNKEATYQRMLSALSWDVRVLFIKMFDRLDNIRDMDCMPKDKKRRISRETLDIYVPIAKRLGLTDLSLEQTELCFMNLYPTRYKKTIKAFEKLKKERIPVIKIMLDRIKKSLIKANLKFHLLQPILIHPSSKVYDPSPLEKVLDHFQIVVFNAPNCYLALGVLHIEFSAVPLQIRDYISNPKWNGYKGIQTELNLNGERIEIEIISLEMREANKNGILSQWEDDTEKLGHYYKNYLKQLNEIADAEELRMADILNYSQTDQIQVFTPEGDLFALPKGATVLDFAYYIHSDLGNQCVGGLINPSLETSKNTNIRVPRERKLFHGECIKVLTNPAVRPSREWFDQSITPKSQIQVRRSLNFQTSTRANGLGRDILSRELKSFGENLDNWLKKPLVKYALKKEHFTEKKFFQNIGLRKLNLNSFLKKYKLVDYENISRLKKLIKGLPWYIFGSQNPRYLIENPNDPLLKMANCCKPIPEDKIVGFVNKNMEIEIHRNHCSLFGKLQKSHSKSEKPLEVNWHLSKFEIKGHTLKIEVFDGKGIIFKITKIIKAANVAIEHSESKSLPNNRASILIRLEPIKWAVYHKIMEGLRQLKFIQSIT